MQQQQHRQQRPAISKPVCARWMEQGLRMDANKGRQSDLFAIMKRMSGSRNVAPLCLTACEIVRSQEALESYWRPLHGAARQTQLMHESQAYRAGIREGMLPLSAFMVNAQGQGQTMWVLRIEGPTHMALAWVQSSLREYADQVTELEDVPLGLIKALLGSGEKDACSIDFFRSVFYKLPDIKQNYTLMALEMYPELELLPSTKWLTSAFDVQRLEGYFSNKQLPPPATDDDNGNGDVVSPSRNGTQEALDMFGLSPPGPRARAAPAVMMRSAPLQKDLRHSRSHSSYRVTAAAFAVVCHALYSQPAIFNREGRPAEVACASCGLLRTASPAFSGRWYDVLRPMRRLTDLLASSSLRNNNQDNGRKCWGCGFLRALAEAVVHMLCHDLERSVGVVYAGLPVGHLLHEADAFLEPIRDWMSEQMLPRVSSDLTGMPYTLYPCLVCTCEATADPCETHPERERPRPLELRTGRINMLFDSVPGITIDYALETTQTVLRQWYVGAQVEISEDRCSLSIDRETWERVCADNLLRTSHMSNCTRQSSLMHDCSMWADRELAYSGGGLGARRGLDSFAYVRCNSRLPLKRKQAGHLLHCARGGVFEELKDFDDQYLPWTQFTDDFLDRLSPEAIHTPLRCFHLHYLHTWPSALRGFMHGRHDTDLPAACLWLRRMLYGSRSPSDDRESRSPHVEWRAARMLPFLLHESFGNGGGGGGGDDTMVHQLLQPFVGKTQAADGETVGPGDWTHSENVYSACWLLLHPFAEYISLAPGAVRALVDLLTFPAQRALRDYLSSHLEAVGDCPLVLPNPAAGNGGGGLFRDLCRTNNGTHVPLHYLFYHLALRFAASPAQIKAVFLGTRMHSGANGGDASDLVDSTQGRPTHYTFLNTHPVCAARHSMLLYSLYARAMNKDPRYQPADISKPAQSRVAVATPGKLVVAGRPSAVAPRRDYLNLAALRQRPRPREPMGLADELVHDWYGCNYGGERTLTPSVYSMLEGLFGGLEALALFSARPEDVPSSQERENTSGGGIHCMTMEKLLAAKELKRQRCEKMKRKRPVSDGQPARKRRRMSCASAACNGEDEWADESDMENGLTRFVELDLEGMPPNGCNYQPADFDRISMLSGPEHPDDGVGIIPHSTPLIETYDVPVVEPFCPTTWAHNRYLRRLARLTFAGQCGAPEGRPHSSIERKKREAKEDAEEWSRRVVESFRWAGLPETELRTYRGCLSPELLRPFWKFAGSRDLIDRTDGEGSPPMPLAYSDAGLYLEKGEQLPRERVHTARQLFPLWHSQWRGQYVDHTYLRHIVDIRGTVAPLVGSHPQLLSILLGCPIRTVELGEGEVLHPLYEEPAVYWSLVDADIAHCDEWDEAEVASFAEAIDIRGSMLPLLEESFDANLQCVF